MTLGARPAGALTIFAVAAATVSAGLAARGVSVGGAPVADPVAVAEYTFPYQHLTMTPQETGVLVILEDGTGYPARTFVTVPGDGSEVVTNPSAASCRDDGLCGPLVVAVRPGLEGTVRADWLGTQCEVSAGPVQRVRVSCESAPRR
ncbi:hypothetical protein [Nakamurella multipartita]|uniref:Secreted protein n=1 Tax=Nakamurella multipartita (strain ATCC 700099 / DSM 44233 / CIP 104796 / JCM 9543 / NBRC 105858 / Y-104) TaxID=479431 RepID=C8X8K5_NAKMY|nr:hypothetical protein [Nakamurella multipartita]ACV79060.1 hypothetical protein Namu_2714 [Nakamurella multipartita DSM 44233]